ncbi:glycosyltransferase family 2 protein [Albibacterium profundi]|uniref:Glycosyltransferase family 2 protein n=1 Tax=Albibacterium profundi TaxID=3134906 RepID=A0ABV5CDH4_9SPHI
MERTTIISVNYNQPQVTIDFLKSVKKYTDVGSTELILVDNGSLINHEDTFKNIYPELIYIRSDKNLGFAGGNNLAVPAATGDFLFFLNNDTELTEGLIPTMVEEFKKNPQIGLLSPLIIYHENKTKIQYAGFSNMNYLTCRNKGIGNLETDTNQYNNISEETGYAHGAAMMCRRKDLDEVGLMEENYFLYYEELDWCEKFRRTGKKIWFTGKAKIYHKESISVGKESSLKTYFLYRNRMLFIRKNTNMFNTFLFSIFYLTIACPKAIASYALQKRKDLIPWLIRAVAWNFSNKTTSTTLGYKLIN